MKVILICGKRSSGKDTFANFINWKIDRNSLSGNFCFRRGGKEKINMTPSFFRSMISRTPMREEIPVVKFATPLRSIMDGLMGLPKELIDQYEIIKDDPEKIEYEGSVRDYAIAVSESVRKIDPVFFAKRFYKELLKRDGETFICTDWRYPNEFEYLKSKDVEIVKVKIHREKRPLPDLDHHSETSLDDYPVDYVIEVSE